MYLSIGHSQSATLFCVALLIECTQAAHLHSWVLGGWWVIEAIRANKCLSSSIDFSSRVAGRIDRVFTLVNNKFCMVFHSLLRNHYKKEGLL